MYDTNVVSPFVPTDEAFAALVSTAFAAFALLLSLSTNTFAAFVETLEADSLKTFVLVIFSALTFTDEIFSALASALEERQK